MAAFFFFFQYLAMTKSTTQRMTAIVWRVCRHLRQHASTFKEMFSSVETDFRNAEPAPRGDKKIRQSFNSKIIVLFQVVYRLHLAPRNI